MAMAWHGFGIPTSRFNYSNLLRCDRPLSKTDTCRRFEVNRAGNGHNGGEPGAWGLNAPGARGSLPHPFTASFLKGSETDFTFK